MKMTKDIDYSLYLNISEIYFIFGFCESELSLKIAIYLVHVM